MLASLPLYVFPLCMLAAAISDVRKFVIPNTVSLVLIAAFLLSFAASGLPLSVLANNVLCGIGMLGFGMILWHFGNFGGGDAKLLASAALWLGWPVFGVALLFIALAGGILAILMLLLRKFALLFPRLSLAIPPLAKLAAMEKPELPYGIAIAIGSLWVFPHSALFKALVG